MAEGEKEKIFLLYPPLEGGSKTLLRFREGAHPTVVGDDLFREEK
jgi:hypothetical protein